jgi:hypothetical protein
MSENMAMKNAAFVKAHPEILVDHPTFNERFQSCYIERGPNECWPWTRSPNESGYGRMQAVHAKLYAHCIAWMLNKKKPIKPGIQIQHTCDCRSCVNPAHLVPGTAQENTQTMLEHGRGKHPVASGFKNPNAKFKKEEIAIIRKLHAAGVPTKLIAKAKGCAAKTIRKIVNNQTYVTNSVKIETMVPRKKEKN